MVYQFREEVRAARKAAMGEMYRLAQEHMETGERLVNFASGHPDPEVFPDKIIRKYLSQAVTEYDDTSFLYEPAGYEPLRGALREFANRRGTVVKPSDGLLVTYGSTEAVYLAASVFVSRGDRVIVEEPSYVNALKAFELLGAEVVGIPVEEDGVNLEALENTMKYGGGYLFSTLFQTLGIPRALRCPDKNVRKCMNFR